MAYGEMPSDSQRKMTTSICIMKMRTKLWSKVPHRLAKPRLVPSRQHERSDISSLSVPILDFFYSISYSGREWRCLLVFFLYNNFHDERSTDHLKISFYM